MMSDPQQAGADAASGVRCPVLVLMGTKDTDFPSPEGEAKAVAGMVADGRFRMIEGVGHFPQVEVPDLAAYRAGLRSGLREPARRAALVAMLATAIGEGRRWAGAVHQPAVVLMGTRDPLFPDPVAEAHAQGTLLDCPVRLIEGAGHYPQSEFPHRTAAALLPFLALRAT